MLSALYGVADAQTTTKTNPSSDTSVGMQRQVNLSPQEQLAQADAFAEACRRMRGSDGTRPVRHVDEIHEAAGGGEGSQAPLDRL